MIVDGRTLGCWWDPGTPGTRKRSEPIRGVVWHWTAGEGAPRRVYEVLVTRGLSIHYVIGADGQIVQMADPATTVCSHAGPRANPAFIGVEIVNKGTQPALDSRVRPNRDTTVRLRPVKALDFLPAQYEAIKELADHLSDAHGIPRVCAVGTDTFALSVPAKFHGHLEHLHVSNRKIDSGGFVMDCLRRYWGQP